MSLVSWIEDTLEEFGHELEPVEQAVIDFGKELLGLIVTAGGHLLIDAATVAVQAAEQDGGTGTDKFNSAKQAVIGTLENAGVQIVLSAIHGAIEFAVAKMNSGKQ